MDGCAVPRTHTKLGLPTYALQLLGGRAELILIVATDTITGRISVHGTRSLRHKLRLSQLLLANQWSHLNHGILAPEIEFHVALAWTVERGLMRALVIHSKVVATLRLFPNIGCHMRLAKLRDLAGDLRG